MTGPGLGGEWVGSSLHPRAEGRSGAAIPGVYGAVLRPTEAAGPWPCQEPSPGSRGDPGPRPGRPGGTRERPGRGRGRGPRPRNGARDPPGTVAEPGERPTAAPLPSAPHPPPPPLRANKQHRGRGERLGGKGFSPSIGYASCLSARPRLSRDSRLFRLVGDHVTPLHRPPARGRRARPPPSPLRAVCKGKTAVKRAAGRSQ